MELVFMYCAIIVCASTRSIFTKQNGIIGGSAPLFNFTRALSALILFSVMSVFGGFSFHYPTIIYGTAYGVLFFCSCCCGCNAMARGPLGITSSLVAFSLVIPCLFGVFFLKEKINGFDITGFALIIVAIILMNRRVKAVQESESDIKTDTKTADEKASSKNIGYKKGWGFYVAATILSDGISATIKKIHQVNYPGAYCKEFMCFGMFFGMLLFIVLIVKNRKNIRERGKTRKKKSILYGSVGGIANGLYNYLILVLAGLEGATALFPIISVSTIAASELSGRVIFKERLNVFQIVGIVLAMVAIFFIKI